MKKILRTTTVLMLMLVLCTVFAACKHEHTLFATDWSQDGESHWHACTEEDCTEISDKAAHVYDNACDATCNVCGATRAVGDHAFVPKSDETNHWEECNICGCKKGESEHTFTLNKDETKHWQECSCGYTKDEAAHSYVSEGTVATTYKKECSACQHSITTSVSEERFADAMALKDEEGNYYTNFEILFVNNTTKVFEYKVTENSAYQYSTATNVNLETIWTNENGKGVIYTKKTADSEWVRAEQESEYTDFASLILPTTFVTGQTSITYDKIKSNYSGVGFAYYITYEVVTDTYQTVALNFEDGKFVNASYILANVDTCSTRVGTRTVTYGDAVIEIPTDAVDVRETGSVVPYNTTDGKFSLEDIVLKSNTAYWYVIDITDSDKSEISGNFTLTTGADAILTVKVEDASGNAITNDATDNGAIHLEGLSAGKYYIKITANKNCKGDISIEYAD